MQLILVGPIPKTGPHPEIFAVKIRYIIVSLIAAAVVIGAYVLSRGFSARARPMFAETFVARRLRSLAVPRGVRAMQNPVPSDSKTLSEAMAHFADHCAFCHANDGSGDTPIGQGLYPKPPDMRLPDTQNLTDGELYYIIYNGVRFTGMPAFGHSLNETQIWQLALFLKHMDSLPPGPDRAWKAVKSVAQ